MSISIITMIMSIITMMIISIIIVRSHMWLKSRRSLWAAARAICLPHGVDL